MAYSQPFHLMFSQFTLIIIILLLLYITWQSNVKLNLCINWEIPYKATPNWRCAIMPIINKFRLVEPDMNSRTRHTLDQRTILPSEDLIWDSPPRSSICSHKGFHCWEAWLSVQYHISYRLDPLSEPSEHLFLCGRTITMSFLLPQEGSLLNPYCLDISYVSRRSPVFEALCSWYAVP